MKGSVLRMRCLEIQRTGDNSQWSVQGHAARPNSLRQDFTRDEPRDSHANGGVIAN